MGTLGGGVERWGRRCALVLGVASEGADSR